MPVIALGLGSLVVAAATYLLGCGSKEEPLEPDRPYPVEDGGRWRPDLGKPDFSETGSPEDSGPFVKDTSGKDVADVTDTAFDVGCIPEPCLSGVIVRNWKSLLEGTCVRFEETHVAAGLTATGPWSGVSVADYNKDGKPDIYLLGDGTSNLLYRNDGGGTFTDVSVATGLKISAKGRFSAWGDLGVAIVTDSGTDLYEDTGGVFKIAAPGKGIHDPEPGKTAIWLGVNLLLGTTNGIRYYKNLGGGSFKEDAIAAGLDDIGDASAFAVTVDAAGLNHIYVANLTGKNRYFQEVSKGSGKYDSIAETTGTVASESSTDAVWVRIEEEPGPSLYVANYAGPFAGGNRLFFNEAKKFGDPWKFKDRAKELGVADPGNTTRAVWADLVGDKRPWLFLGRWNTGEKLDTTQNLFYGPEINVTGKVTKYIDHAFPLGMATKGKTVGAGAFDYNADGRIDLGVVYRDGLIQLFKNESHPVKLCPGGG